MLTVVYAPDGPISGRPCTDRAVAATADRNARALGGAVARSHSGAMPHTVTVTPVPASAAGRVCATVDGKLSTVRPVGPRRAISSSGSSVRMISSPVAAAMRCRLGGLSRRCAK